MDSSFCNPDGNSAVLTGFEYALADDATVYYWINAGTQPGYEYKDYFVQSLCFEWMLSKRFTYVLQYNLANNNYEDGTRGSAYGINNHFLYKLNDRWGVGTRFEWLRSNDEDAYDASGDFYQITLGLNWNPYKNVSVRPEVRYDWSKGTLPFGPSAVFGGVSNGGKHSYQVSGGCGVIVSF
jgi:hypothetical protein